MELIVDSENNIYVIGYTTGGIDRNTNLGGTDIILIKYNSSLKKIWSKQLGTPFNDFGTFLSVDSSNNIYLTGYTFGELDGNKNFGGSDIILIKYNSNGDKLWSKQIGTEGRDEGASINLDSNNNIYITGSTNGELMSSSHFGDDRCAGRYCSADIYMAKFNKDGILQSIKQMGDTFRNYAEEIFFDSKDNIYITGYSNKIWDENGDEGLVGHEIILTKLIGTEEEFFLEFGTKEDESVWGGAIDSNDNIYLVGYTNGSLHGNLNFGENDIIFMKFNVSGQRLWTKQIGTNENDYAVGITIDVSNNIYVTGYTNASLNGNYHFGKNDIFIMKFNSNGTILFTKQVGSHEDDYGQGIRVDSNSNIYVIGYTRGEIDGNQHRGGMDIILLKYNASGKLICSAQI